MTDIYRKRDEELLDEPDSFIVRMMNELRRIEDKYRPFESRDEAFGAIMDEVREIESDINRGEGNRVLRHQLAQIAARCWRFEKDLLE